jgi:hypothetical protein
VEHSSVDLQGYEKRARRKDLERVQMGIRCAADSIDNGREIRVGDEVVREDSISLSSRQSTI